jgi:hypothetical protein
MALPIVLLLAVEAFFFNKFKFEGSFPRKHERGGGVARGCVKWIWPENLPLSKPCCYVITTTKFTGEE